ncbi:MAG: hypothetical protein AAF411_31415, partial [Myxococcota bacterium]
NGCLPTRACWDERYSRYRDKTVRVFDEMGATFWDEGASRTCSARCDGDRLINADCSVSDCGAFGVTCLPDLRCGALPPPEAPESERLEGPLPALVAIGEPLRFDVRSPVRLFDTRPEYESRRLVRGDGTRSGRVAARTRARYTFGAEAAGAQAAWMNVTAVPQGSPGFISTYPSGVALPETSTLNHTASLVRANGTISSLGEGAGIDFYSRANVHLIADLAATLHAEGDGLVAQDPTRVYDSRRAGVPLSPGVPREIPVSVPAGTSAVVATITVVPRGGQGFVSAFPCGGATGSSLLNFQNANVVSNATVVPVREDRFCVQASSRADVIVDLNGTLRPDGALSYQPLSPTRVMDTRDEHARLYRGRLAAGQVVEIPLGALPGMPDAAWTVAANVAALNSDEFGFLTLFPCGGEVPNASNVNYAPGEVSSALTVASLGPSARLCVFSRTRADLIVDVLGVWVNDESVAPPEPAPVPASDAGVPADAGVSFDAARSDDTPGDDARYDSSVSADTARGDGSPWNDPFARQPVLSGGCSTGAAKPSSLLGFLVPTLLLLLGTRRRPAG